MGPYRVLTIWTLKSECGEENVDMNGSRTERRAVSPLYERKGESLLHNRPEPHLQLNRTQNIARAAQMLNGFENSGEAGTNDGDDLCVRDLSAGRRREAA
jgi:hypothetical protein